MMHNSGIGNIVNPLTSLSLMYKIPALLIVGWRGYGRPPNDAPEHWIMGIKTPEIFDLMSLGNLPLITAERPGNLIHIILDNEAYESTGGQPSISSKG